MTFISEIKTEEKMIKKDGRLCLKSEKCQMKKHRF